MKSIIILVIALFYNLQINAQNVGIGTTTPNPSAKLEIASTTKGFLPPRMTLAQRNAIVNPTLGLIIFCYDCDELQIYNGTNWVNLNRGQACIYNMPNVAICNQIWMGKNLDVDHYRNGDPIPQVTDPAAWINLTTGAWCYYNNDPALGTIYGKLYNWYAVIDPRGLAPLGWHVPSDAEWTTLSTCLGGDLIAGSKMKEAGTSHWQLPNSGATNSSGFTALPGGNCNFSNGLFYSVGNGGFFWSSTNQNANFTFSRKLSTNYTDLFLDLDSKTEGFSVRCILD